MPWSDLHWKALELAKGRPPGPSSILSVASQTTTEAAAWAFTQWELRKKAAAKFTLAHEMIFTREGLEMASSEPFANLAVSLLRGDGPFLDATAGIGSHSIALGKKGEVRSLDLDKERLSCCSHNKKVYGAAGSESLKSCLEEDWSGFLTVADPARRSGERKRLGPEDCLPPLANLLEKGASSRHCWIKLSPGMKDEDLAAGGHGLVFVGAKGECSEALMECGREAGPPSRRAIHLETGSWIDEAPLPSLALQAGAVLYEPHPAALRAHAHGNFGLEALGSPYGWLTGPGGVASPFLEAFEVLGQFPWREKTAASLLKGLSLDAVKTRGLPDMDPQAILKSLRKKIGPPQDGRAELLLWREGPKVKAALCRRLSEGPRAE